MLRNRELADVVQKRGDLDGVRVRLGQFDGARQVRRVVLHPLHVTGPTAVLRLNRPRQHFRAFAVKLRPFGHPALLVGNPPEIDPIGAIRQAQRNEREQRLPVPRALKDLDGDARGYRANRVARDAPEKVVVPHTEDVAPVRKSEGGGHRHRVHEKVGHRGSQKRLKRRGELPVSATEPGVGATRRCHCQSQARDAEERPMRRIPLFHPEAALRPGAGHRDQHRRPGPEQEQRGEVDGVRKARCTSSRPRRACQPSSRN